MTNTLIDDLSLSVPVFQAPMAGVSTPAMAAAVSEAGGLGALGLGAATPEKARAAISKTQALTARPFNVNLFCHAPAHRDTKVEQTWIDRAAPLFARFETSAPTSLREIYTSFRENDAMLEVLLETRPAVVSFHFGLPTAKQIEALRTTGARLIACATSLEEAQAIEAAGLDAVIAQGWSAGGHRGIFDPGSRDRKLSTEALTRELVAKTSLPVIAAGGIMDGADIRTALADWGAVAAQLGTAFVACPESAADDAYRARMEAGGETIMTSAISGRPARCLSNAFTAWGRDADPAAIPAYPCAYDLGKALNAAAKAKGEIGFGAQWAGEGVALARPLPAADLVTTLAKELQVAG
ncbi:NAD(P)H-dependent flavin oxidoreductase [Henriciella aquimarina]|uniref:NAD(P)H-dependent flavin oxidoreductase n=1 Tax=Henriciella aquimarina TaxID=545261 RepID=UPI000A00F8D5|nr:nitronate monooxygenase [Henriciella aquimarina]